MSSFTMLVIMSFLMIAGGFSLLATPLITFLSTGYFIIILFFAAGVTGIISCVVEKRYVRELLFAIVSLGLGAAALLFPGLTPCGEGRTENQAGQEQSQSRGWSGDTGSQ